MDRLVGSNVLKGSESLCKLLRFLAERSVAHPGEPIKEYQIATEVFGRPADFDPRLDATVRVQTGRLRSKLAEYYALEGLEDEMILDIPKGSYSLSIHPRAVIEAPHANPPAAPAVEAVPGSAPVPPMPIAPRPPALALLVLSITCLGLLAALVYVIAQRPRAQLAAPAPPASAAPAAVQAFWHGFVDQPEDPLVVFSNAEFVGRPETGMRYFDPARDSRSAILDHYTGVGEVLGIHELDRVFTSLQHGIRVKRGRLLSLDDTQNNDLIFAGSPSENLTLREIPTTQDFVFRLADSGARKGDLEIVNLSPRAGEDRSFMGSKTVPITEDYALIGLVPGVNSGRWVLILAGTTTIGTQAAIEYVCRERDIKLLLSKAGTSKSGGILPFEAVIRIKVAGGVPLASQLVALHPRTGG
ncbi:MAG: hypothetical protein LAP87_03835 [Acidobacteriia bacterium]|nr:hypothetical protein [Terriglobia bacterium]